MRRRSSLGRDPLDWIGIESSPAAVPPPLRAAPEERSPAAGGPATLLRSPTAGASVAAALVADARRDGLDRQMLLMEFKDFGAGERRSSGNQILLLLVFLFATAGTAIYCFREARYRFDEQVDTLEAALGSVERGKTEAETLLRSVIAWKDQAIEDKDALIRDLRRRESTAAAALSRSRQESQTLGERLDAVSASYLEAVTGEAMARRRPPAPLSGHGERDRD